MPRGIQTLTSIFPSSVNDKSPKGVKGDYTKARDTKLAYRFYFYYHIKRSRYDDLLGFMATEFDTSPRYIADLLKENQALLKDIALNQPTAKDLAKRYPFLNWN